MADEATFICVTRCLDTRHSWAHWALGEKMPGSQGVGDAMFEGFRVMALGFLLAEWPLVMCAWEFGLTLRQAFKDLGDWV